MSVNVYFTCVTFGLQTLPLRALVPLEHGRSFYGTVPLIKPPDGASPLSGNLFLPLGCFGVMP